MRFFSSTSRQFEPTAEDGAIVDYFLREDQHLMVQLGQAARTIPPDDRHLVDAIARRRQRILFEAENIRRSIQENNYDRMVERFEQYFDNYLKNLLQKLSEQVRSEKHIAHLVMRLDYNGFYSRAFEEDFNAAH